MTEKRNDSPAGSPFRVRWPAVSRLNRNALWVATALGVVTAVVAVAFLVPSRPAISGESSGGGAAPVIRPQRPSLPLERPAAVRERPAVVEGGVTVMPPPIVWERAAADRRVGRGPASIGARGAPHEPADEAYRRALTGGVLVGGAGSRGEDIVPPEQDGEGASTASDRTSGHRPESATEAADGGPAVVRTSVEMPVSPYELETGTVIPLELVTGINSDLPGEIVGQVSRDVYDSRTQLVVLIPRGARLIGRYDDRIVTGQSRVLVAWTRVQFPDGRSVALPAVPGVDEQGATGISGSVDNHLGPVFERAGMLSALSVGAQLSQPRGSGATYSAPSTGQVAAGAVGQELSQVGLEMVRQGLSVKPTITVKGGTAVQLLLTRDLVFDGPYEARGP